MFTVHVLVLAVLAYLLLVDIRTSLIVGVNDDAGYYFRIAYNELNGFPGTYDWLHPTNGFNPLYKFLLVHAFSWFDSQSLDACYRVGVALTFLFSVGCLVLFWRLVKRLFEMLEYEMVPSILFHGLLLFYLLWMALKEYYGTDGFLVLFFQLAFVNVYLARTPRPLVQYLFLGLLALLAVLARLDALSFVAAFLVFFALRVGIRHMSWKCLVAYALPVVVGVGLYVGSNQASFGTLFPVSGMLKNSFPHVDVVTAYHTINFTSSSLLNSAVLYVSLFAGLVYVVGTVQQLVRVRSTKLPDDAFWLLLYPLSLYALAHTLFYVMFSRFDFQGLYIMFLNVYVLIVALVLVRSRLVKRYVSPRVAGSVLGTILVVGALGVFALRAESVVKRLVNDDVDERTIGHELEALTADGDVLFGENFGLVGFFTRRIFINGDGVVNEPSYLEVLAHADAEMIPYLERQGVTHLFGNSGGRLIPSECEPAASIHEWKSHRGRLVLCRRATSRHPGDAATDSP